MKKLLSFIVMATLLVVAVAACGGGDDEDKETPKTTEPTTPSATSPRPSPSPTAEPTPTVEPTQTPKPTPTPPPTVEPTPTPTPTVDTDSAAAVLAPVMTNLVVAFAEVGGQWQGYAGPNALALTSLENGKLYWWYATQEMTLDTVKLYKGWNNMMWLSPSAPVTSALAGKEASILFVVVTDIQSGKNYLYQSPQVKPLSVIPVGQKYSTFVAPPGNLPQMATKTR